MFDEADFARHHQRHEVLRLLVNIGGIDEDFADFVMEVIADGAHHQIAFEIDQERRGVQAFWFARAAFLGFLELGCGGTVNRFP